MSDETKTEPKKEPELVTLDLSRMLVSPLVYDLWDGYRKLGMGSKASLFEDMALFCLDNGFKPSRTDRRGER
jgi:hypothetical protein